MPAIPTPAQVPEERALRETVCIHTRKIYDSCRDKDCLEDLRVFLTASSRAAVDTCVSVRPRSARLVYVSTDVDEVSFNRGYYTVNIRFYYEVRGDANTPSGRTVPVEGISVFDKRVMLFGSEGTAKVFSSDISGRVGTAAGADRPVAVVEAVDPIILDMKVMDGTAPVPAVGEVFDIPEFLTADLDGPVTADAGGRFVTCTLGQFSIVRLERDSQLLIPAYSYCMPDKECVTTVDDDPCSLFSRIDFPVSEFFPPDTLRTAEGYREVMDASKK